MRNLVTFVLVFVGCTGEVADPGRPGDDAPADTRRVGLSSTAFAPRKAAFSAAEFIEAYCSGCHQPAYVAPSGRQISLFTADARGGKWRSPFASTDWFEWMDYETIVRWGPAIRCGVHPDALPEGCASLSSVAPGFFTTPRKFPPTGTPTFTGSTGYYGANPSSPTPAATCAFAYDGHTCPQPSDDARAQMVAWIDAGYPR